MSSTNEQSAQNGFRIPVVLRSIVIGLAVGLIAANVWVPLLVVLGMPGAALAEAVFLALYFWWAGGGGIPASWREARRSSFRRKALTAAEWRWAIPTALAFAITVHAAMVVLFRFVPFPAEAFRQGYNFPATSLPYKWLAIVVSAISAGVCEETGFRGYMQRPIEQRHGAFAAIAISSAFFALLHLSKGWDIPGMVPIVFGAGVLLGLIAWASNSLLPGMIGHAVMDTGLFAYWWTDTAGTFHAKTVAVTGYDTPFVIACSVLGVALLITLAGIVRLRALAPKQAA
jgi:membrane protease YdiL (CAAX protease family)